MSTFDCLLRTHLLSLKYSHGIKIAQCLRSYLISSNKRFMEEIKRSQRVSQEVLWAFLQVCWHFVSIIFGFFSQTPTDLTISWITLWRTFFNSEKFSIKKIEYKRLHSWITTWKLFMHVTATACKSGQHQCQK